MRSRIRVFSSPAGCAVSRDVARVVPQIRVSLPGDVYLEDPSGLLSRKEEEKALRPSDFPPLIRSSWGVFASRNSDLLYLASLFDDRQRCVDWFVVVLEEMGLTVAVRRVQRELLAAAWRDQGGRRRSGAIKKGRRGGRASMEMGGKAPCLWWDLTRGAVGGEARGGQGARLGVR